MRSQRHQDSSGAVQRAPRAGIDLPFLVVSTLTAFFATLFATLLLLRGGDRVAAQAATAPAAPVDAAARGAPITAPVDAAPPTIDPGTSATAARATEPGALEAAEDAVEPSLRERLEQLGVRCAEGADCQPD